MKCVNKTFLLFQSILIHFSLSNQNQRSEAEILLLYDNTVHSYRSTQLIINKAKLMKLS